jgi:large subunit ribosomal protein L4
MESVIYNQTGKEVGKVTLPEVLFGVKWNADMVHQVVTSMMMNRRQPVAHAKNRGEVSGGGKKPWRQKGTGRARHGSIRSPLWVGGGVTHGPRNDKNFSRKVNKKMAALAMAAILSRKLKDGEVICLDSLNLKDSKTKEAVSVIRSLSSVKGFEALSRKPKNALCLAMPENNLSIKRGFRNIGNVKVLEARNLNAVELLNNKYVAFINPEESFKILSARIK